MSNVNGPISRRRALALGGGLAGGLVVATSPLLGAPHSVAADAGSTAGSGSGGSLPVQQIETIMQTTGTVSNGVLTIDLDRTDLHVTGPHGLLWQPAFELTHEFYFQPLGGGLAILNAEMTLLSSELNPAIDQVFAGGLFLMAEHQHFFDENPQTWHIHFRGLGDPVKLALAAINVVKATATPLPQTQPSNPTTPLPTDQLASILGGTAMVGSDGVVTISIPRAETIFLAGIPLQPETGVSVTIAFEPLDDSGDYAACAPDYALIAREINPALQQSRAEGFEIHCLYNQETAEFPQLYFSHNLRSGDPIVSAKKVAKVLALMNVKRS